MHWFLWTLSAAAPLGVLPNTPAQATAQDFDFQLPEPGEYRVFDATPDDSVPLPIPARWHETPAGDVLVEPAGGDPFFLGFAAGAYYPPAAERVDPELLANLRSSWSDGRPEARTWAFVMFQKRITRARIDALEVLGVRVLEFHPHHALKVALTAAQIDQVEALDFVRWVGVQKRWQKFHPALADALAKTRDGELVDAHVNLFESDLNVASVATPFGSIEVGGPQAIQQLPMPLEADGPRTTRTNGWQERALEALGLEVRDYEDTIRAFSVRLSPANLAALAELDFVQFVEPDLDPTLVHDESMPMVNLDRTRLTYDGGFNQAVVAGQADSGLEYSHSGLTGFYWLASNLSGSSESSIDDLCGHGSHVAGTIHGNSTVDASYEGGANGLAGWATGRYFNAKIFYGAGCWYGGASMSSIMGAFDSSYTDSNGDTTPRPHAINHSWGTTGAPYYGTEADCRTIDASVYTYKQLHVFAAGNEGPGGQSVRMEASAKNVLTVGSVDDFESSSGDPGIVSSFSSRGPTADLRWKPNVCAPGSEILSVDADTASGYTIKSGTSMAAPHVTALAAQMCDRQSFFRHNPTTLSAVMMATALTKDNALISSPSTSSTNHLNQYGTGRIEAWKALYTGSQIAQYLYGWDQGTSGWVEVDVPVNSGATRIVVCLNYHEPAASSGASTALVNDLDLWIDIPPFTAGGNTGDYTAQQSIRDNTEIRILDNPTVGTWRIKVYSDSGTSVSHVGLGVSILYGDTTPTLDLVATASDTTIKPNQDVDIDFSVDNPETFASAVYMESIATGDNLQDATTTLYGSAVADHMDNYVAGRGMVLGDMVYGSSRSGSWTTRWATEGVKSFVVQARSDNAVDDSTILFITVDGTPPGVVTNLTSPSHQPGVWSNNPSFVLNWTAAPDNLSGIAGYNLSSSALPALPGQLMTIGPVTTFSAPLSAPLSQPYSNLRAVDDCDNWSASYASWGPLLFDNIQPSYITGLASSSHQLTLPSCNPTITMVWDPVTDGHSGVAGFGFYWDHSSVQGPNVPLNLLGNVITLTDTLSPDPQPWYLHITPYDVAGNNQNQFIAGPYSIIPGGATSYCTGKVNSLGCTPTMASSGMPSFASSTLVLSVSNVLNNKNGLLFHGTAAAAIPFQGGTLCVAPPIKRTAVQSTGGNPPPNDCSGTMSFAWTTTEFGNEGYGIAQQVFNQYWSRDPQSASTTSLSNAMEFTICQ